MVTFNIEVISDPICSWCFIAHRALEKAIQLYQKTVPNGSTDHFEIIYLPHYLVDPATPSRDKKEYPRSRQTQDITYKRITKLGRSYGISFDFVEGKIGGTREAHRLIQLAQSQQSREVRDRFIGGVFSAFHEKAMDITDWETLKSIAVESGIGIKEVDEWESKDIGADELDYNLERARKLAGPDSRGVPITLVQGAYRFDGAPDVFELIEAFTTIRGGEMPDEGANILATAGTNRC